MRRLIRVAYFTAPTGHKSRSLRAVFATTFGLLALTSATSFCFASWTEPCDLIRQDAASPSKACCPDVPRVACSREKHPECECTGGLSGLNDKGQVGGSSSEAEDFAGGRGVVSEASFGASGGGSGGQAQGVSDGRVSIPADVVSSILGANSGFVASEPSSTHPSPVPLPDSLPMFGAALVVLGTLGYGLKRRSAKV